MSIQIDEELWYNYNVRDISIRSSLVGFNVSCVNTQTFGMCYRCAHPEYGTFDFPFTWRHLVYNTLVEFDQLLDECILETGTISHTQPTRTHEQTN